MRKCSVKYLYVSPSSLPQPLDLPFHAFSTVPGFHLGSSLHTACPSSTVPCLICPYPSRLLGHVVSPRNTFHPGCACEPSCSGFANFTALALLCQVPGRTTCTTRPPRYPSVSLSPVPLPPSRTRKMVFISSQGFPSSCHEMTGTLTFAVNSPSSPVASEMRV